MPKLLLRRNQVLYHLASTYVTHDGSIQLQLVRGGISDCGYQWRHGSDGSSALSERTIPEPKTKSISIHTSGRINYKYGGGSIRYISCLMDLEGSVLIVAYSIPSVELLDVVEKQCGEDWVGEIGPEMDGRLTFHFVVMPAVLQTDPGELGRYGVEGLYALAWGVSIDDGTATREGLIGDYFTSMAPTDTLPQQAIAEEVVYLRFRRAMYANDIIAAVERLPNKEDVTAEQIEAAIAAGPSLYPPNGEGIWTILASVPMRAAPKLDVEFQDTHYRAEVLELRPGDTRLATVRVRFRVIDARTGQHIKEPVVILKCMLDARL